MVVAVLLNQGTLLKGLDNKHICRAEGTTWKRLLVATFLSFSKWHQWTPFLKICATVLWGNHINIFCQLPQPIFEMLHHYRALRRPAHSIWFCKCLLKPLVRLTWTWPLDVQKSRVYPLWFLSGQLSFFLLLGSCSSPSDSCESRYFTPPPKAVGTGPGWVNLSSSLWIF